MSNSDSTRDAARSDAFRSALRELGHIEGQNLTIEYRYSSGDRNLQRQYAGELVNRGVDLIFAASTTVALTAKNVTQSIPIVFLSATEPVASGLVKSLAHPEGNLTGFATIAAALAGKRLELLKETAPKLSRLAIMW